MDEKEITCRVMSCSCICEQQDKLYGKGNRVFNKTKNGFKCTSCKKDKK